jgi:hypothetical protein
MNAGVVLDVGVFADDDAVDVRSLRRNREKEGKK